MGFLQLKVLREKAEVPREDEIPRLIAFGFKIEALTFPWVSRLLASSVDFEFASLHNCMENPA